MIKFRVNGIPAPQGSKTRNRAGALYESSRAVGPWREAVRAEAQACWRLHNYSALEGPLSVTVVFMMPRPQSHYSTAKGKRNMVKDSAPRYPATRRKNDIEKLARSTLDALVDGGIMADDGLVCSLSAAKVYASNDEAPGALIEVEAL